MIEKRIRFTVKNAASNREKHRFYLAHPHSKELFGNDVVKYVLLILNEISLIADLSNEPAGEQNFELFDGQIDLWVLYNGFNNKSNNLNGLEFDYSNDNGKLRLEFIKPVE